MTSSAKAVVTGMGILTSLGAGLECNWRRLVLGDTAIDSIRRFDTTGLKTRIAAVADLPDADGDPDYGPTRVGRAAYMAERVIAEALATAGVPKGPASARLVVAGPCQEHEWPQRVELARAVGPSYRSMIAAPQSAALSSFAETTLHFGFALRLHRRFGFAGVPLSITTACASGATAIQLAVESIARGETDVVVVVGADGTVTEEYLVRFSQLSALSTANDVPARACKPFAKDRDGFVFGEGAAALVLERPEHARARGATVLADVLGCGEAGDNFHRTRSDPSGRPILSCMKAALDGAGIDASEVDHINAHGTGTPENDAMEAQCISKLFGSDGRAGVPVTSNKSIIGHTIAAGGLIEGVFSIQTLRTGVIPPTINYEVPDPEIAIEVVANRARPQPTEIVMSNSFGFGGQNVSLVFGKAGR